MSTYKARKEAANKSKFSNIKLLTTSALTAAGLIASGTAMAQNVAPDALPQGATVTKGSADYDYSDARLDITQNNRGITSARYEGGFNIGLAATVNVNQVEGDTFVHVDTSGDTSYIEGVFQGDAGNIVLNRNGVLITGSARIDMNSFAASTAASVDFDNGKATFKNLGDASVEILDGAQITIAEAGVAAFVAPTVKNAGVINAKLGKVAFAAGETVTLDLYGDGLFEVEVEGELADAYLENTGTINANGGVVQMTALAAKDVAENIINLDGVVDVSSATQVGGKIILSGGNKGAVTVKGKADATGKDGGQIEVTGQAVIADAGAEIDASGTENGGDIKFGGAWQGKGDTPTSEFAYVDQDAILRNNSGEDAEGGEVVVWSDLATFFYGNIEAAGGRVETSGKEYLEVLGSVTADEWLLDPRNLTVRESGNFNAFQTFTDPKIIGTFGTNGGNTSFVTDNVIEAALNDGTSVTLRTGNQDNGDGDITVNAEITKTSGTDATLRLEAHDDIFINQEIESTQGALNVELIAGALGNRSGDHNVEIDADIKTNGGNVLATGHNISLEPGDDVTTSGGNVEFRALEDIFIDDDITTAGGSATFIAGDDFVVDDSDDFVSTQGGKITVEADFFDLDGQLNAETGEVSLSRSNNGQIDLGDSNGSFFRVDQAELNRITADTLTIGNASNNADNNIRIDNADFSSFAQTTLNTRRAAPSTSQDALFQGTNKAQALTVNADDDIRIASNSSLETTGDVVFNTDTNVAGVGSYSMGTNATLDINGNDLTVNTINVGLGTNAKINAEGGNIDFNNTGVFASADADSVSTNGTGTIELNQNGGDAAGASIQNAIDAINNTGTGQNTLFTDGAAYTEDLDINQADLKINGADTLINGVITVNASNFHLDPVTVDAGGADFGLIANGIGALGLIVDGNTFKNSARAGIYVEVNTPSVGVTTIKNNTFEGSATRGVETGNLRGPGYELNILDNTIGSIGDEVQNGLNIGRVINAKVNIERGTINATSDAVYFSQGTFNTSQVILRDVVATSLNDEAVDVQGIHRVDSTFDIIGGTFVGGANGVEFQKIDGSVNIENASITGNNKRGLNLLGTITGGLFVDGGSITGNLEGIGSNNGANNIDGGAVAITNTDITGTTGDGVEFQGITGFGSLIISGTTVTGGEDGVNVAGDVDGGAVFLLNNDIEGQDDGVDFTGTISNGSIISLSNNTRIEGLNTVAGDDGLGDGIAFGGAVSGVATTIAIDGNTLIKGDDRGINFRDITTGGPATITDASIAISANDEIRGENLDGILFNADITNAKITIGGATAADGNGLIIGNDEAIDIENVNGGQFAIANNTRIEGVTGDGIEFEGAVNNGAVVTVSDNGEIVAAQDGVTFEGAVDSATVNIDRNDIEADDHGIAFDENVSGGSTVNINDNVISANADANHIGSGIFFDGTITDANINIGDGTFGSFVGGAANIIEVAGNTSNGLGQEDLNGIHFDKEVGQLAKIKIDGNRIGYRSNFSRNPIANDGIRFNGDVTGNADIDITDNYIRANDEGIEFSGEVRDTANVLIGAATDNNFIRTENGNGIEFADNIEGEALIEISYADISAAQDGIVFSGNTSNAKTTGGISDEEIYIHNSQIRGEQNGVSFEGLASNNRHDIKIEDNNIRGVNGRGVVHAGGINNARIDIINNDSIRGGIDGVQVTGFLYNDADVNITGNQNVRADLGDGIEVTDTGFTSGSDVNILGNEVIAAGNNGIEVARLDDVEIRDNTVTNASNDGINVDNSDRAQITGNTIFGQATASVFGPFSSAQGAGRDGIHVEDSHSVVIDDNTVQGDSQAFRKDGLGAARHGIYVTGGNTIFSGNGVQITNNNILGDAGGIIFPHSTNSVGADGIRVENNNAGLFGTAPEISGNEVERTGENGIYVDSSNFMLVNNNDVTRAGDDGIQVINSFGADITNNRINITGDDGIDVENSFDADVRRNLIAVTSGDGIEVSNAFGADIRNNIVLFAGDDGIDVQNSNFVDIADNSVGFVGANGIEVENSDNADIERNFVGGAGQNGIYVNPSDDVNIDSNIVISTLGDGIQVNGGENADVTNNLVLLTGDNGINVNNNTGDVNITDNTIALTGGDGIEAFDNADGMIIADNTITFASDDGIDVERSRNARVDDNTISNTGANGIEITDGSNGTRARDNTISNTGENGIFIQDSNRARANDNTIDNTTESGIYFDGVNRGRANRNTITDSGENGIVIKDSNTDVRVHDNVITGSIISGIEVDNVDGIGILRNDITDSGVFGLLASGPTNGDVTLVGNTFTDNPTGARFESGNIDISDLTDPNSFINTDPAGTPVGLQFDEVGIPGSLTIAGNTLGGTVFNGFNNIGSFYVRIENGTLLDTGTGDPIVIDGLNANFDGFVPASVGGILTIDQLTFLEDRLFDADDIPGQNSRGQIFVGAVPGLNFEDFIREFGATNLGTSGLNLRIASLPAVDGASLAAIEPAAGGEGEGGTADDFASIEPAAGEEGENTSCLGDAVASASAGVAANYSFGGTFEDSLADASACQSGIQ